MSTIKDNIKAFRAAMDYIANPPAKKEPAMTKRPPTDLEVARAIAYNETLREPEPKELSTDEVIELFEEEPREPESTDEVPTFYTVAIYLCDRAYGGPEEGGWWYDCGERQDFPLEGVSADLLLTVFHHKPHCGPDSAEIEAMAFAEHVQKLLDVSINVGRREISSMASTGRYYAEAHPGYPPHHYPEVTPHYE